MSSPYDFPTSIMKSPSNYIIPTVIESEGRMERAYDIYSRLLKDNIIFVGSEISDAMANIIVAQLLFLDAETPDKDVYLYINSPGGSVTAGLAIYDTMQFIRNDVSTICIGQAASMGAVLLAAGTPGKRYILPNSRVMLHQPLGGTQGVAADVEIYTQELLRIKDTLFKILQKHTGQSLAKLKKDADRDLFLNAQEAVKYSVVDRILEKRDEEQPKR